MFRHRQEGVSDGREEGLFRLSSRLYTKTTFLHAYIYILGGTEAPCVHIEHVTNLLLNVGDEYERTLLHTLSYRVVGG